MKTYIIYFFILIIIKYNCCHINYTNRCLSNIQSSHFIFRLIQNSLYRKDYITALNKKKKKTFIMRSRHVTFTFFSLDYSNLFYFFFILSLLISPLGDALLYMFRAIAFRNNRHHMTMYVGVSYEASRFFFPSFFIIEKSPA